MKFLSTLPILAYTAYGLTLEKSVNDEAAHFLDNGLDDDGGFIPDDGNSYEYDDDTQYSGEYEDESLDGGHNNGQHHQGQHNDVAYDDESNYDNDYQPDQPSYGGDNRGGSEYSIDDDAPRSISTSSKTEFETLDCDLANFVDTQEVKDFITLISAKDYLPEDIVNDQFIQSISDFGAANYGEYASEQLNSILPDSEQFLRDALTTLQTDGQRISKDYTLTAEDAYLFDINSINLDEIDLSVSGYSAGNPNPRIEFTAKQNPRGIVYSQLEELYRFASHVVSGYVQDFDVGFNHLTNERDVHLHIMNAHAYSQRNGLGVFEEFCLKTLNLISNAIRTIDIASIALLELARINATREVINEFNKQCGTSKTIVEEWHTCLHTLEDDLNRNVNICKDLYYNVEHPKTLSDKLDAADINVDVSEGRKDAIVYCLNTKNEIFRDVDTWRCNDDTTAQHGYTWTHQCQLQDVGDRLNGFQDFVQEKVQEVYKHQLYHSGTVDKEMYSSRSADNGHIIPNAFNQISKRGVQKMNEEFGKASHMDKQQEEFISAAEEDILSQELSWKTQLKENISAKYPCIPRVPSDMPVCHESDIIDTIEKNLQRPEYEATCDDWVNENNLESLQNLQNSAQAVWDDIIGYTNTVDQYADSLNTEGGALHETIEQIAEYISVMTQESDGVKSEVNDVLPIINRELDDINAFYSAQINSAIAAEKRCNVFESYNNIVNVALVGETNAIHKGLGSDDEHSLRTIMTNVFQDRVALLGELGSLMDSLKSLESESLEEYGDRRRIRGNNNSQKTILDHLSRVKSDISDDIVSKVEKFNAEASEANDLINEIQNRYLNFRCIQILHAQKVELVLAGCTVDFQTSVEENLPEHCNLLQKANESADNDSLDLSSFESFLQSQPNGAIEITEFDTTIHDFETLRKRLGHLSIHENELMWYHRDIHGFEDAIRRSWATDTDADHAFIEAWGKLPETWVNLATRMEDCLTKLVMATDQTMEEQGAQIDMSDAVNAYREAVIHAKYIQYLYDELEKLSEMVLKDVQNTNQLEKLTESEISQEIETILDNARNEMNQSEITQKRIEQYMQQALSKKFQLMKSDYQRHDNQRVNIGGVMREVRMLYNTQGAASTASMNQDAIYEEKMNRITDALQQTEEEISSLARYLSPFYGVLDYMGAGVSTNEDGTQSSNSIYLSEQTDPIVSVMLAKVLNGEVHVQQKRAPAPQQHQQRAAPSQKFNKPVGKSVTSDGYKHRANVELNRSSEVQLRNAERMYEQKQQGLETTESAVFDDNELMKVHMKKEYDDILAEEERLKKRDEDFQAEIDRRKKH